MDRIKVKDQYFKKYISAEKIASAVTAIAESIRNDYKGRKPLFLVVMKGAMFFGADLIRETTMDSHYECIKAQSYGDSLVASGAVTLSGELPDILDEDIIIIEDIIDTGHTLFELIYYLKDRGAKSVKTASLFSKPESIKYDVKPDYVGFEIDPHFIIGYGLDYAQEGRYLKDIYILDN
jgi:hypoxanthine phosphoribosyltransferase